MSVFAGLDTEAYDRTYNDRDLIRRIFGYFGHYRKRVWATIFFVTLVSFAGAAQPLLVSSGIEALGEGITTSWIVIISILMAIFGVGVWLANWIRRRLTARLIGDVISEMRRDAFEATINHDMGFFDEYSSGRIMSRITTDTQEFAQVVVLVTDIANQVILIFILFFVLLYISVPLTFLMLAFSPIVLILTLLLRRLARFVTRRGFQVLGEVNASIQEAVTGISVAKNFRQEETIYKAFGNVNSQAYEVNLRRGVVLANVFPLLVTVSGMATATLLYQGGYSAEASAISVGAWYLFIVSLDRFWFPMINIAVFWSQFQAGLSASERIFALIDTQSVVQQTDNQPAPNLEGEITFEKVDFRYSEQEQILQEFSLRIAPGESIALVGHTGAGKSSLVKLITRFYEFQKGRICIDGQDIRTLDLASYRHQLGIVSQVPFLFDGTVADNIRYARPELTDADIEAVARRIGHGEWLETLPEGLATDVGERGARLSMGQRQLVVLTRVLAQQPAIFILDEATASVDPFTESQIQEALDLILEQSTSIMIAHRLSTIRSADRILVLKKGQIIEEGSHDQLMTDGGHYAELYDTYFRHQSPDFRPASEPI